MTTITIGKDAKRASKAQAHDMARLLKQGEKLTDKQLDSLLLYFAPAQPKKAKAAIEWAAKAAAVQDVRKYLCYVWVSPEGVAYATDGHCLHAAEVSLSEYPSGYYCPKTLASVPEMTEKYPDCERVFANNVGAELLVTTYLDDTATAELKGHLCYQVFDQFASVRQMQTATNGDGGVEVSVYVKGDNKYGDWRGNSEFGRFVIVRMKND